MLLAVTLPALGEISSFAVDGRRENRRFATRAGERPRERTAVHHSATFGRPLIHSPPALIDARQLAAASRLR